MSALFVVPNLSRDGRACIQFAAGVVVHPDALSPLGDACNAGLVPGEPLVQSRGVTKYTRERAVLDPDCKMQGFAPKRFWQPCLSDEGAHALKEAAVEGLSHSIVLGCVVRHETLLGPLLAQECSKLAAQEFPPSVSAQAFDFDAALSFRSGCEGLICIKGFILGAKEG
jgi:hypothetical protein